MDYQEKSGMSEDSANVDIDLNEKLEKKKLIEEILSLESKVLALSEHSELLREQQSKIRSENSIYAAYVEDLEERIHKINPKALENMS